VPSNTENKERGDKKERKTNLSHHTTYGSNQTSLIAYTDEMLELTGRTIVSPRGFFPLSLARKG
jgi:hypothetical protein